MMKTANVHRLARARFHRLHSTNSKTINTGYIQVLITTTTTTAIELRARSCFHVCFASEVLILTEDCKNNLNPNRRLQKQTNKQQQQQQQKTKRVPFACGYHHHESKVNK